MLLGSWWVSSTHTPLIVRWIFKVWYLWHRQCTHKHTLKHQGFIKIQETPQRPFADQMDEPAPWFFLTVGWMGYQLLWASLATLVSLALTKALDALDLGSWDPANTKIRLFTLLFFCRAFENQGNVACKFDWSGWSLGRHDAWMCSSIGTHFFSN